MLLQKAKESLQNAIQLDANDKTNSSDQKLLDDMLTKERVVTRSIENNDLTAAINYTNQILAECPASERHCDMKFQLLMKNSELKEAVAYSKEVAQIAYFQNIPSIMGWRGRMLIYNGNDEEGKKVLLNAINQDPDNKELIKAMKNIKLQNELKDQASKLFKQNKIQDAIEKFKECLNIDPLNINYNATIHLNIGIGKFTTSYLQRE